MLRARLCGFGVIRCLRVVRKSDGAGPSIQAMTNNVGHEIVLTIDVRLVFVGAFRPLAPAYRRDAGMRMPPLLLHGHIAGMHEQLFPLHARCRSCGVSSNALPQPFIRPDKRVICAKLALAALRTWIDVGATRIICLRMQTVELQRSLADEQLGAVRLLVHITRLQGCRIDPRIEIIGVCTRSNLLRTPIIGMHLPVSGLPSPSRPARQAM